MPTSNAANSKKIRLAGLRENIKRQEDVVKRKNQEVKDISKRNKQVTKGKGPQAEMQAAQLLNMKKQDAFRAKQRLLAMKAGYQKERGK